MRHQYTGCRRFRIVFEARVMMAKTAGIASMTIGIRTPQTSDFCAWTVGIDKSAISVIPEHTRNVKPGPDGEPGTRAAWSSSRRQDRSWTQQNGAISGILGRAPAHLTFRSHRLATYGSARCSRFARNRAYLAREGSPSEGRCQEQEILWRQFFLDSTLWWDNRQHKKSPCSTDFLRKGSLEVVWVNNCNKPTGVEEQVAAFDAQMACKSSLPDNSDPGRGAGNGMRLTAVTVSTLCEQGKLTDAVEALEGLVQTDCTVSKSLVYTVLKQCVAKKDLVLGRRVHALTAKVGYESDTFLCNHVLRMYASHARLQEAMDVFRLIARPDAFTWSSIISAHVKHGQPKQAIQLYHQMRSASVKPDGHVFVAALQACARGADVETGQQVHADVLASGVEPDLVVVNCLVDMYAKCGSLEDAQRVFDGLRQKDVVTWTAMIAAYAQQGMGQEALHLYSAMQEEGITAPNSVTYVCLLLACTSVGARAMEKGKQLHAQIGERGLEADVVVGSSLVNMYAKCGSLEDAQRVFDRLPQKNVVTWNAMIAGYANCGNLDYAKSMFDRLPQKNVVAWNAMIAGYSQQGMGQEALQLYSAMQDEGITTPNSVTFVSLLQACASVGTSAMEKGKQIHAQIGKQRLETDLVVACSLVNMYAKCGNLEDARSVFDRLPEKDVVTWNAMIAGYSQQGMGQEALHLYSAMQEEGIAGPNSVTFVCLLQACASVGNTAMEKGKQLHAQMGEEGLETDVVVGGSLVNMYAKCGSLEDAQSMFDRLPQRNEVTWNAMIAAYANCGNLEDAKRLFDRLAHKNVVTWNTMIAGYSQHGLGQEALHLYSAMQEEGIAAPDSVTFVCVLQACASVGTRAMEKGKQLHAQIRERELEGDAVVGGSLVNMYAKCGSLEDAQSVFDRLPRKNVVTWNAMIAGYSQQGMGQEALNLYSAMQEEGIAAPDSVTFVCLLEACASVSALSLGKQLHAQIEERGLEGDQVVGNSLVNMYAKCGSMVDAQQVFNALPKRDNVSWSALIAGYTRQGDSEVVFDLVERMREDSKQPDDVTFLSVLTVCSHAGLVNKGRDYFEAMSRLYGITPTSEHYTCMVDLLGRAGQLLEALEVVRTMPAQPNHIVWHTLLGACQKWSNVEVGRDAFDEAVKLDEKDAAAYVMMSNIYSRAQMWEEAQKIEARRRKIGAWKQPGQSWWTDMSGRVHAFLVGDKQHPESEAMYVRLKQLVNEGRRVFATS